MRQETLRNAIELAQQRWAAIHAFDIDLSTWQRLFTTHRPGDVLQAIRLTKDTVATDPAKIYERFERLLTSLEEERFYIQN